MTKLIKITSLIYLLSVNSLVFSQNLVPNPSFEDYTSCPTGTGQITLATLWISPTLINHF